MSASFSLIPQEFPSVEVVDTITVSISFAVAGKSRPRFDGRSGRAYMPAKYICNIENMRWLLRAAMFEKPAFLSATARYILVVHLRKKRRKKRSKSDDLNQECPLGDLAKGKPDWDNAGGTISDAASKILYDDDAQVVCGLVYRTWSEEDGAEIKIYKLKEGCGAKTIH